MRSNHSVSIASGNEGRGRFAADNNSQVSADTQAHIRERPRRSRTKA